MNGPAHRILAASAATSVAVLAHAAPDATTALIVTAFATGGGPLSPDIDMKLRIPHRTVTHYPIVAVAVAALVTLVAAFIPDAPALAIGVGVLVGWLSHYVADGLTKTGVPHPLAPVARGHLYLLPRRVKVGAGVIVAVRHAGYGYYLVLSEWVAVAPFVAAACVLGLQVYD